MFVVSVKSSKKKIAFVVLVALAVLMAIIGAAVNGAKASKPSSASLRAASDGERIAFLSQFGWEVEPQPTEVKEVIIPQEFDEVYTAYNEIQKKQGFDLTKYSSLRVKRWTYEVKNYPCYEESGLIRANVLVYDGTVIGGDICCIELDGFMHGFELEAAQTETQETAA